MIVPENKKEGKLQCREFWSTNNLDAKAEAVLNSYAAWVSSAEWNDPKEAKWIPRPLKWLENNVPDFESRPVSDDGGDETYIVNKPRDTDEDWARCCSILAEDRAAGLAVDALLNVMAERWPGREVPA